MDHSLSDLLRELRDVKGETSKGGNNRFMGHGSAEESCFNTNFVSLFEKNEGMVHLEGLELLSKDQERRTKALTNSRFLIFLVEK